MLGRGRGLRSCAMGMQLAILIFDGLTALDAVGPYEVLSRVPGIDAMFVATEAGVKRSDNGMLGLVADRTITEISTPELVLVPGGHGELQVRADEQVLTWLRSAHETTRFTTSVCTGSLVLAAAGLLDGVRATTHWTGTDELARLGATPVAERVVRSGRIITAAGVSSGIDMGLTLAAALAGDDVAQAIQLSIEYDPEPPFDAGSPTTAPAHLVDEQRRTSRFSDQAGATT
jgi:putative intracellular protease/amidase